MSMLQIGTELNVSQICKELKQLIIIDESRTKKGRSIAFVKLSFQAKIVLCLSDMSLF